MACKHSPEKSTTGEVWAYLSLSARDSLNGLRSRLLWVASGVQFPLLWYLMAPDLFELKCQEHVQRYITLHVLLGQSRLLRQVQWVAIFEKHSFLPFFHFCSDADMRFRIQCSFRGFKPSTQCHSLDGIQKPRASTGPIPVAVTAVRTVQSPSR